MIELNPLVINHVKCKPPPNAPADEFHCTWYELTDKVTYLPGIKGTVNYKACFHDLPRSIQTHVYAPAGLEIKEKWSIGGNEPHEEREIVEIGLAGLGVPREGLYLREDVDMRCNIFLTNFVKKTLRKAHQVLVDRLVIKADLADDKKVREGYSRGYTNNGSSIYSSTAHDSRVNSMVMTGKDLDRHGSIRSDGASSTTATSPTTTMTAGMPVHYNLAELPEDHAPAPLNIRGQNYDHIAWSERKMGLIQPHASRHPSNAFGIPPAAPIEME